MAWETIQDKCADFATYFPRGRSGIEAIRHNLAHGILIARVPFNTEVDPQRAVDELLYNKHGLINVAF